MHQRLGGLWERVGDAVTEALAQTSSVGGGQRALVQLCLPDDDLLSRSVRLITVQIAVLSTSDKKLSVKSTGSYELFTDYRSDIYITDKSV